MADLLRTEITFLPNVRNPRNFKTIPLKTALLDIKKGTYRNLVEDACTDYMVGDDAGYKAKKLALPSYGFHGTFEGRVSNDDFQNSSSLIHFDIDNLSDSALLSTREFLIGSPFTVFAFASPSGNGLKGCMRVDPDLLRSDADFKVAYAQIEHFLADAGVKCDPACKDVRRICFTSYDPELYFNKSAEIFPLTAPGRIVLPEEGYTPLSLDDVANGILPDITIANAAKYLPEAGEQNYGKWRDIGAILHHQFQGSAEGLELFDTWSQGVREYKGFDDVARQWSGYKRSSGSLLTFKSLVQAYNEANAKKRVSVSLEAVDKARVLVESCDDFMELTCEVAPNLWKLADRNVALEKDFLKLFTDRYALLRPEHTLGKMDALRAMKMRRAPDKPKTDEIIELNGDRTPRWARDWVWVSRDEVFFNVVSRISLTTNGFRSHFNSNLPAGEGAPSDCAKFLLDNDLIPKVMRMLYMPAFGQLFTHEGITYINAYSDAHRAIVPDVIQNQEHVDRFIAHIAGICGGWNRKAILLANFLSFCVGAPPTKVRWAPLLIGTFGDGKSLIHSFVSTAMGLSNTRSIACSTIISAATTGFSGWAEGHIFGLIDELKLNGHNKHDVMNALKVYLTDDIVPCMLKGGESRQIMNTANFWFNSNFRDCAPVEDGNRRLFVLISQLDLPSLPTDYFDKLHEAIQESAGDIVRWLWDLPHHRDFKPNGHAPMTDAKVALIRLSKDDLGEQILEILEDEGNPYFSGDVVLFEPLFIRLSSGYTGLKLESPYKLSAALTTLGFSKIGRSRIAKERHTVWVRHKSGVVMTIDQARIEIERKQKNYIPMEDLL